MMHTWHSKAILFESYRTPVASLGWKRNASQLRHQKLHLKVPEHRSWRVNPLVKSRRPNTPEKGLEGCTGGCKAEDARHGQPSPSLAAAALALWYWYDTSRHGGHRPRARGPSAPLGPSAAPTLRAALETRAVLAAMSSCQGRPVNIPPVLRCSPPGILEEAVAHRKGRLEEAVSVRVWSFWESY